LLNVRGFGRTEESALLRRNLLTPSVNEKVGKINLKKSVLNIALGVDLFNIFDWLFRSKRIFGEW
jgi:hypothetical protein